MPPVTRSSTLVPGSSPIATMATGSTLVSVTEHIINICGFLDDLTTVDIFKQEGWTEIADIAMLTMQEADSLLWTNSDGSYKAKPMNLHLCWFKGLLMYYNKKGRELSTTLND
jgi:predicted nucleic acid-binding protein